ncbi:MAG: hypothetical protein JO248_13315 [Acidimicrobiia bacterium]|nr:hypothetical protein [Acidimicrobiia bacterium]
MIGALELTDLLTRRSGSGLLCVSYVVALPIAVAVPAPLHLGGNAGVIVGGVFIGTVGLAVLLWRTIRGWEGLAVFRQMFAILSRRRNEPPPDRRDT